MIQAWHVVAILVDQWWCEKTKGQNYCSILITLIIIVSRNTLIGVASFGLPRYINETYIIPCIPLYMPVVYARINDEIMNWIRNNTDDRTAMKKSNCDDI